MRRALAERSGPSVPWPGPPIEQPAAVLVPVFEEDGQARIVLTRRASHLRRHRGEVSFPGGRLDRDEEPAAAALREAAEEVGIDPATVDLVGELSPLSTMSSNAAITPFVGVLPDRPALRPNPEEVEHAFDVALADLLAADVFEEEVWTSPDRGRRPVYFFHLPDDTVWGATARILYELLALVVDTEP